MTSQALAVGHSICPYGGAAFTSASGVTYACNGEPYASPRDDPARIVTGTLNSSTFAGPKIPCSPPGRGLTQCITVAAGPLVITDLGMANGGEFGTITYFFLAGPSPDSPTWIRTFVLSTLIAGLPRLQDSASGLNLSIQQGESLYVAVPDSGSALYSWSGFHP